MMVVWRETQGIENQKDFALAILSKTPSRCPV